MEHVVIVGAGQAGVQVADSLRLGGFGGDDQRAGRRARRALRASTAVEGLHGCGRATRSPCPCGRERSSPSSGSTCAPVCAVTADRPRQPHRRPGRRRAAVLLRPGAGHRGGQSRLPVPGADLAGVHVLRTLADAEALRAALATARSAVVVGAGFIGLEFAAAARKRGVDVTVLEAADRPMARAVSPAMSRPPRRRAPADGHRPAAGGGVGRARRDAALGGRGRRHQRAGVPRRPGGRSPWASVPATSSPETPAWPWTTGSSSTSTCGPPTPTSTRSATAPAPRGTLPARASGWSPCRTRPTRAGGSPTRSSSGSAPERRGAVVLEQPGAAATADRRCAPARGQHRRSPATSPAVASRSSASATRGSWPSSR